MSFTLKLAPQFVPSGRGIPVISGPGTELGSCHLRCDAALAYCTFGRGIYVISGVGIGREGGSGTACNIYLRARRTFALCRADSIIVYPNIIFLNENMKNDSVINL